MLLEDLPEDILVMILKKLDIISMYNLYCASLRFRSVVRSYRIIRSCSLSLNCIAKAQMLRTSFFDDISEYLQDINLCGMVNLRKSLLLPAARRLKKLISLNVSYTNINLFDLIEIYQACPTLKRVCVNFVFGDNHKIPKRQLLQCQSLFKNFECVHFVGSCVNLMYSKLSLYILLKAKLKTLQYTISENEAFAYEYEDLEYSVNFDYLQICFPVTMNSDSLYGYMNQLFVFDRLPIENYEFIIIIKPSIYSLSVFTSPLFEQFFIKNFNVTVVSVLDFCVVIAGNVSIMIWNKESTTFDEMFFTNLFNNIKIYFPTYVTGVNDTTLSLQYDWYFISPQQESNEVKEVDCPLSLKRRRIAPSDWVLDYDILFQDKKEIDLSVMFNGDITTAVTLSPHSEYLRKITYLNLSGYVKYSSEFFNILFRCCEQLVTLNVESPSGCSCVPAIARSIPLSQTIKNLRILDRRIDFITLMSSLSQCQLLENVHLCDISSDYIVLPDFTAMFLNCNNLYCLYIYGRTNKRSLSNYIQMLHKAKKICLKSHITFNIMSMSSLCYDPFIDVFKPCVIKPILYQ